ncbi:MAG: hypothetical protein ACR2PW_05240 [Gammaproteobacteria bacterium]
MRIYIDLTKLDRLANRVSANNTNIAATPQIDVQPLPPLASQSAQLLQLKEGLKVSALEANMQSKGYLNYRGIQASLYIWQYTQNAQKIRQRDSFDKRYHITWCKDVQYLARKKSYQGRMKLIHTTDETFAIEGNSRSKQPETADIRIPVCRKCLKKIKFLRFWHLFPGQIRTRIASWELPEFVQKAQHEISRNLGKKS